MTPFRSAWSRPAISASVLLLGSLGSSLLAQPTVTLPYVNAPLFSRPGGSTFTWLYPTYSNANSGIPDERVVTGISYYNVGSPANYALTRGKVQYATSTAGPWTDFPSPTLGLTNVTTAGRVFRFVDSMAGNSTTVDSVGAGWNVVGHGSPITSGTSIHPDLPPTDVFTSTQDYWHSPALGEVVVVLRNTDTGAPITYGGKYSIDGQSVPNLFAISGENLVRGTGALPAVGTSATVTLRYHDLFQLDNSGNPVAGEGVSRTVTLTRRGNPTGFSTEVLANTYTTGVQQNPAIAGLTDGSYVVVWRSTAQGEGASLGGIYGQKFTAAGAKSGSEFAISTAGNGVNELAPAVAALPNGRFVVTYAQTNTDNDVKFRLVEANGTVGSELSAPSSSTGAQTVPAVDSVGSGFAITWLAPSISTDNDVWVRQFGTDGTPVANSEYVINSTLTGAQTLPDIAGLSDGSYVAIWRDPMNDGDVRGRKLGTTGGDGAEFAITSGAGAQNNPKVAALAGGGFVVVYQEAAKTEGAVVDTTSESNIYGRVYNNAAAAQGNSFLVNVGVRGNQNTASVTGLSGGGFLVNWTSNTDPDASNGVFGRRFSSTGTAIEHDFELTQNRIGVQHQGVAAPLSDDGFAAAWVDATLDGDGNGVVSRRFTAAAPNPNLTINDVSLNEGNAGTTSFTFTVSLSAPAPAGGVTFDIATADGTAIAPGDYTAKSLTSQTIPAGSSTYSFTVLGNGDTTYESNETFFVNVTNASNATITDNQGVGTIVNDDADTTAPDTTITGTPTNPTNDNTPTFTFTGTDNVGVTGFEARLGTTGSFTAVTSPYTPSALTDGTYTFQVRAKDAAGNVDATPASYTFTVDATAPAAPVATAPANGSRTADNTPTYTGTAEAGSTVTVIVDGTPIGTTTAAGGNWTLTQPVPLADGSHSVRATAADALGNNSGLSSANSFTVDTTAPPAPVVVTPANGSTTADSTPAITGTAEASSTVNVIIDGSPAGTANADAGGNWTFTSSTLALGAHTVRSTATDAVGNTGPNSNTNTFTVSQPVTITGTLTASGSFIPGGTVTYTAILTNTSTAAASLDNPGNEFQFTLPSQLSMVSGTATSGSVLTAGSIATWNGGIPASGSVTISIMALVKADATGTVSAQGTINYDSESNGSNESTASTDDPNVAGAANPTTFEVIPGSMSLAHAVIYTSVGGNDGVATIGESLAHTITVTMPDGANPGTTVRGQMPAGLAYTPGSASLDSTGFNGTVSAFTVNLAGDTFYMTMNPTATADGIAANNRFIITFQTTVRDVVTNVGLTPSQTALTLGFTHNNGGLDSSFSAPPANASVTVVEPSVLAAVGINQPSANVGGTVNVAITLQNTGTSPAHEVSGSFTLPATHFNLASLASLSIPNGFAFSLNSANGLLTYSSYGPLAAGASGSATFNINLAANAPAGPYTTPVLVTQASTLAGNVSSERSYTVNGSTDTLAIVGPPAVTTPVVNTTTVDEGGSVAYTISGSFTDNDGTFTGVVDWGDGSTSPLVTNNAAKTYSYSGSHTYAQSGTYNVTAKVTNTGTFTGTSSVTTITVNNVAPVVATPNAPTPEAALAGVSTSFTLSGSFTDPAGNLDAPYTATVNWGDGTTGSPATIIGSGNPFGYSVTANHTYATSGTKNVTVTVTDANGGTTTSDPITVQVIGDADYAVTTTSDSVTITDNAGNGDTLTVSQPSAGQIRFAAPNRYFSVNGSPLITGSSGNLDLTGITNVTINPAGGSDIVTFNSMANLPSITINDGAGGDQVRMNSVLSFASGSSLQVSAESISVGAGSSVTTSGAGNIRLVADGIVVNTTANITTQGSVELAPLTADRPVVLGVKSFVAFSFTGSELNRITTPSLVIGSAAAGSVDVQESVSIVSASSLALRTGGAITSLSGNYISNPFLTLEAGTGIGTAVQPMRSVVSKISATTGTGRISIRNNGNLQVGDAATNGIQVNGGNEGIFLEATGGSILVTKQIKSPGAISLTATGAASDITVLAGIDAIQTTATATPSLAGISLKSGRDLILGAAVNPGDVISAGATRLSATNDVVVDGTTYVLSNGNLEAIAGGDVLVSQAHGAGSVLQVVGTGDSTISAAGSITLNGGTANTVAANNGAITLITDQLNIPTTGIANVVSTTGVLTIKPSTLGLDISVGTTIAGPLSLTDAVLDKVTVGGLALGDSTTGSVTVSDTITRAAATNVTLASGSDISLNGGTINTAGGNLTLVPGTAPALVRSTLTGTDAPLGGGKLAINGRLELAINGTTAGSGYEQVVVNGTVNASATSLVLTGTHVPVTGNTFTLVNNDGSDAVTGNFVGLPEGGTVTFNGILMRITYTGGDGNDIVLGIANRAPTNISLTNASLPENAGANAEIGTLSSTDPDTGDTFTYSLVGGTGDTDNIDFNILGNKLRLTASANYEAKSSYSVVIRTTDQGTLSYDKQFTITVTDVAESPTITAIESLAIDEDATTGALAFTIADQDGGSSLTVTATSNNQTLVPNANITLAGTDGDRTVTVTPVANGFGTADITVVVSDGVLTGSTTFTLTVNSVNDLPVIANGGLPDVVLIAADRTDSLNLETYFSDIETLSSALVYTVTPAPGAPFHNLTRTGNTLNLAATAPGEVVITVTARDANDAEVTDTFILRVKHVPEIAGTGIPDTLLSPASTGLDIILGNYFLDQDSDALTYTVADNTEPGIVSATIDEDTLTLRPLGAGVATLTVRATDSDGNFTDHTFDVTVNQPVPDPIPTVTSPPKLNRQTGLYEITLTAVNNNQFNVPGFRFRVTSVLPTGTRLYNSTAAPGSSEAYLDVLTVLTPGQSITVVLEFYSATRNFAGFEPTIIAEPLPEGISNAGTGEGMAVNRFVNLPDGSKLIEFSSIAGRWYEVEYSSDMVTWKRSLVPVQAGANFTQWIDRGAPYTESHPSTVPSRFYRVSEILPD